LVWAALLPPPGLRQGSGENRLSLGQFKRKVHDGLETVVALEHAPKNICAVGDQDTEIRGHLPHKYLRSFFNLGRHAQRLSV